VTYWLYTVEITEGWQAGVSFLNFAQLSYVTHTHTQPFYCSAGICPGLPG